MNSYMEGFFERDREVSYQPVIHHLINLIAVEILSDHDLDKTTI